MITKNQIAFVFFFVLNYDDIILSSKEIEEMFSLATMVAMKLPERFKIGSLAGFSHFYP